MPALSFAPALSFMSALTQVPPTQPLRTWLRATGNRLRPPRLQAHVLGRETETEKALSAGAGLHRRARFYVEHRPGRAPTVVLGGFVPDAAEQVFILRGFFLKRGSTYYVNLSPDGFSLDLFCAQMDDLVSDIQLRTGLTPHVFAVSFGAGLILEWLRRRSRRGAPEALQGITLISPVACAADLLTPGEAKPSTLLGRAVHPFLQPSGASEAQVEKARSIFLKMFEAGAQNKAALGTLISRAELDYLRHAVLQTIRSVSYHGACERIRALAELADPTTGFGPRCQAHSQAPALILYAEKEDNVLVPTSPTRFALTHAVRAYFPAGECHTVSTPRGPAVQHASLVFHAHCFLPYLKKHYDSVRRGSREAAAA